MEGGPSTYQAKKHSIEEQTARNEKKRKSVTGEETRRCCPECQRLENETTRQNKTSLIRQQ
jgi:hypothetical protein